MTEFDKKIIIENFIIKKNKAKTMCCGLCREELKEDEVIVIYTKLSKSKYGGDGTERLHISCFYPFIESLIFSWEQDIKKEEKTQEEYNKLIERYNRLVKELPNKINNINEKIEQHKKIKKSIIEILDKHDLLSDVVVEKL